MVLEKHSISLLILQHFSNETSLLIFQHCVYIFSLIVLLWPTVAMYYVTWIQNGWVTFLVFKSRFRYKHHQIEQQKSRINLLYKAGV